MTACPSTAHPPTRPPRLAGVTIAEIFETEGEAEFRKVETMVMDSVKAYIRTVVSTGGGAAIDKANWAAFQSGVVVYLDVPAEVLTARLDKSAEEVASRPMLADGEEEQNTLEKVSKLLGERRVKYEQADIVVTFDGSEALDDCALKILNSVSSFIDSNPPKWKQWQEKAKSEGRLQ